MEFVGKLEESSLKLSLNKQIGGTINHGIAKSGFNTIGIPKVTGSLILNTPIGAESCATVRYSFLLEKIKMAIISAIVTPEPPI